MELKRYSECLGTRTSRGHEAHSTGSQPLTLNSQPQSQSLLTSAATPQGFLRRALGGAGPVGLALASWLLCWPGATQAAEAPPQIQPSVTFQHTAVFLGQTNTFTVAATGEALSYQWRLDGQDLPGETNQTCIRTNAQLADEGDYTVQVSNTDGAVISEAARLWVVPPSTNLVQGNFTNEAGLRLPYFITVPTNYDPAHSYPLVLMFHGAGITGPFDETFFPDFASRWPFTLVFASYHQQATDPVVLVWPSRRAGDDYWTDSYLRLVSGLLDELTAEFNIDTNRVYVGGGSEGVHATWDLIAQRPGYFAGAIVCGGYPGIAPPVSIKDVPVWGWHSLQDEYGGVEAMRALIRSLRLAGGDAIYTEYLRGTHMESIAMGMVTPANVEWLLAQRRGAPSTTEPLLSITNPTAGTTYASSAATLDVAGSAAALGQPISRVDWTNTATHGSGVASGTNLWNVTSIPLVLPGTNLLIVTATTTSWSAGLGGTTTFNDTLTVIPAPLRVTCAPDPVALDCDLTYTLTVANYSSRAATGVVVSNALPPEVRFISATASQGSCAHAQGVVTCELGSLAVLATATVTLVVQPASLGTLTNLATVTAHEPEFTPVDPAITTLASARFLAEQPQSQTVRAGSNVTFSVTGPCGPQTTYQWQHNGVALPGATAATLALTNVQVPDEGSYTVLVAHPTGSVLSDPALLVVHIRPVAIRPPLSQSVVEGGSVTFSVEIAGHPPPFLYSWRRGTPVLTNLVLNERTCFFTLSNVQTTQGGGHRLVVTNAAAPAGLVVANFTLTVLVDTDADGLPDTWETACGLCPTNANDAAADYDGDGLTNAKEYLAGTHPTNALSYLKVEGIRLDAGGEAARLEFLAASNKTYTVQYREAVDSGEWCRLADVVAVATNRVVEITDAAAGTRSQRVYRLATPRVP